MKIIKHTPMQIWAGILLILITLISCTKEKNENLIAMYTSDDAGKMIVQTIATNTGTGLNDLFEEWYTDSLERAAFCRDFTHAAKFMPDESGFVFVESMNGYNIAHPSQPALEGTSTIEQTDADGKKIVEEMISIAKYTGFGFLEYAYLNQTNNQVEPRTTFVKSIPAASWYCGSPFFHHNDGELFTANQINEAIVQQSVISMAKGLGAIFETHVSDSLQGVELMRSMLKHIRFFDDQSGYFYVIDFSGYNVVQPPDPSIQGTYEWDIQDSRGNYLVQGLIETAKNGGGYYSYYWIDYQSNEEKLKTAYVEQIPGKDYLIGSGIYSANELKTIKDENKGFKDLSSKQPK